MKPICVNCQRFYRPETTGIAFIESYPHSPTPGYRVEPGTAEPENWKPYKLWSGDLWKCQGCGSEIIVGTGRDPISIHHAPDFAQRCKDEGAQITVNDC